MPSPSWSWRRVRPGGPSPSLAAPASWRCSPTRSDGSGRRRAPICSPCSARPASGRPGWPTSSCPRCRRRSRSCPALRAGPRTRARSARSPRSCGASSAWSAEGRLAEPPTWGGGGPDAVTVRLDPLSEPEALDLAMAAGEAIDRPTAERIAVAAGGNPFFIVEATGMYGGGFDPVDAPHSHRVPPTEQAVVASRIDHLPPEARELLRRASVFARSTIHEDDLRLIDEQDGRILDVLE